MSGQSSVFILSENQILNWLYGPYGPGSRSQSVYFKAKPQCICLSCVISWIFHNIFSPYKWIWERKFIGCVIIFVKIFKSRRLFFSLFSLFLKFPGPLDSWIRLLWLQIHVLLFDIEYTGRTVNNVVFLCMMSSQPACTIYHTRTIITPGLYIFYSIFQCGL